MSILRHIIIAFAAALAVTASGRVVWHDAPVAVKAGEHAVDTVPASAEWAMVHVRAAASGKRASRWGVRWGDKSVSLQLPPFDHNADVYPTGVTVTISSGSTEIKAMVIESGISTDGHANSIKIVYDKGQKARVYAGEEATLEIGEIEAPGEDAEVTYFADSDIRLQGAIAVWERAEATPCAVTTIEALRPSLAKDNDPITGVWKYLDRSLDEGKAALDTRYNLAIAAEGGSYTIYQLTTEGDATEKGRLRPTIFTGNYDMTWITADGAEYSDDTNAQVSDDGGVLTLRFPALGTQLRFSRVALR